MIGEGDDLISASEAQQYGYALADSADSDVLREASAMEIPGRSAVPAGDNDDDGLFADDKELLAAGESPDISIDNMTPDEVIAAISGERTSGGEE